MADDITVQFEVQKVDLNVETPSASVLFKNPYNTGPEDTVNMDVVKAVNIPFNTEGFDRDAWDLRLQQQAQGMKHRFGMKRAVANALVGEDKTTILNALVGETGALGVEAQAAPVIETPVVIPEPPAE